MKECNLCKTLCDDSAEYCYICGTKFEKIGDADDVENSNSIDSAQSSEQSDNSDSRIDESQTTRSVIPKIVSAVIVVCFVFVFVIGIYSLYFGESAKVRNMEQLYSFNLDLLTDVYEPNDSAETATFASVGTAYTGFLSSINDKDYYRIPTNGHSGLSFTFVQNSQGHIEEIGWDISYNVPTLGSHMAWLNDKVVEGDFWGIKAFNDYFIVCIENTEYDDDIDKTMEVVSQTEYAIIFKYTN